MSDRGRLARRQFIRVGAGGVAALWADPLRAAESILRDPYAPVRGTRATFSPIRVRGAVRGGGKGLGGIAVTDGLEVVQTAADGTFELVSATWDPLVSVTVPAGYHIPTESGGPARAYRRVTADPRGEGDALFDLERLTDSTDRHAFLVLADIQAQDTEDMTRFLDETVPDVQQTLRDLSLADVFAVADGDIMYDHLELYDDYEVGARRTGIPYMQVVGNHDLDRSGLTDEDSTLTFTGRFGPRHHSFDRGAVHYVVLDDVLWHGSGYIGYLGWDALTWLERDLALIEPGRTVIVFTHIPVLGSLHARRGDNSPPATTSLTNREALYRLLEPFTAHVVTGHTHENEHLFTSGVHEHVTGAVCGAWWTADTCSDGTPNGYAVYEVDGEEVRWRHKSTGRSADHQIRIHAPGRNALSPEDFTVNVWGWDPAWTVVWYADGESRGPMQQRLGVDPDAVDAFLGTERPKKRPWVEPYPTQHMFLAPSAGVGTITVEATDRFGRVHTAALEAGPA